MIENEMVFFDMIPFFKRKIVKDLHLQDNLPTLLANEIQVKQILDNLIKNAIDAMEKSNEKRLTIRTAAENRHVNIIVEDSGEGIPREKLSNIFSPDYTTKPLGKGTGLGLASVKTMVEAYSGTISVDSTVGKGTLFQINLPVGRGKPAVL
jgi:signal transduction histidine kinase